MAFSGQLLLYWVVRRFMVRLRMMGECMVRFGMSHIGSVVLTSRGGQGPQATNHRKETNKLEQQQKVL